MRFVAQTSPDDELVGTCAPFFGPSILLACARCELLPKTTSAGELKSRKFPSLLFSSCSLECRPGSAIVEKSLSFGKCSQTRPFFGPFDRGGVEIDKGHLGFELFRNPLVVGAQQFLGLGPVASAAGDGALLQRDLPARPKAGESRLSYKQTPSAVHGNRRGNEEPRSPAIVPLHRHRRKYVDR